MRILVVLEPWLPSSLWKSPLAQFEENSFLDKCGHWRLGSFIIYLPIKPILPYQQWQTGSISHPLQIWVIGLEWWVQSTRTYCFSIHSTVALGQPLHPKNTRSPAAHILASSHDEGYMLGEAGWEYQRLTFTTQSPELCLRDFVQEEKKSIIKEKPRLSSKGMTLFEAVWEFQRVLFKTVKI